MTTPEIPNPQISSTPRSPVTTQIEVPHQSQTQSIAPRSPHSPKSSSNQLCIHGFKLDVIKWKLKEKGPNPMLLLWETSFGRFLDTWQPWKKVLRVSKLLGKYISLCKVLFLLVFIISFSFHYRHFDLKPTELHNIWQPIYFLICRENPSWFSCLGNPEFIFLKKCKKNKKNTSACFFLPKLVFLNFANTSVIHCANTSVR